jgi:hypothetical protein
MSIDTTTFILLVAVAGCLIGVALARKSATEYVYYDPNETFPTTPQPWGRDDYQPWPGLLYDNPEEEIAAVTKLWNEAMDEGDTVLASALFDDYERLCREHR